MTTTNFREGVKMYWYARFGVVLGELAEDQDPQSSYSALVDWLKKDARVKEVKDFLMPNSKYGNDYYPANYNEDTDEFLTYAHTHVITFPTIVINIEIPRRLQPLWDYETEPPSIENYWVAWDGRLLTVMWKTEAIEIAKGTDHSGTGLIALEIIKEAAKHTNMRVSAPGCSPYCNYPYSHTIARVQVTDDYDQLFVSAKPEELCVNVLVPVNSVFVSSDPSSGPDFYPDLLITTIHDSISFAGDIYGRLKMSGKTIRDGSRFANEKLSKLLEAQERIVSFRRKDVFSPKKLWKRFVDGREASQLTARIWVVIASVDQQKFDWQSNKHVLEKSLQSENTLGKIFDQEIVDEISETESTGVDSIKQGVEFAAQRLDTRRTSVAALIGGSFGGLVGALATILIGYGK